MNKIIVYLKSQNSLFSSFLLFCRCTHRNIRLIKYALAMHTFWLSLIHWDSCNWFTLDGPTLELIHVYIMTSVLHLPHEAHLL